MRKIIMTAFLGALLTTALALADQETNAVMVPAVTGILSGAIYGSNIKEGNWVALFLSSILIGRAKDRIFRHFDKESRQSAMRKVEQLAAILSLTCESKKDNDGIMRSTYVVHVDDRKDAPLSRYAEMSDLDDLFTMLTVLLTMIY